MPSPTPIGPTPRGRCFERTIAFMTAIHSLIISTPSTSTMVGTMANAPNAGAPLRITRGMAKTRGFRRLSGMARQTRPLLRRRSTRSIRHGLSRATSSACPHLLQPLLRPHQSSRKRPPRLPLRRSHRLQPSSTRHQDPPGTMHFPRPACRSNIFNWLSVCLRFLLRYSCFAKGSYADRGDRILPLF
jgi:hypothetical protein